MRRPHGGVEKASMSYTCVRHKRELYTYVMRYSKMVARAAHVDTRTGRVGDDARSPQNCVTRGRRVRSLWDRRRCRSRVKDTVEEEEGFVRTKGNVEDEDAGHGRRTPLHDLLVRTSTRSTIENEDVGHGRREDGCLRYVQKRAVGNSYHLDESFKTTVHQHT